MPLRELMLIEFKFADEELTRRFFEFFSVALTTADRPKTCLSCDAGLLWTGVCRLDCVFWSSTTLQRPLLLIGFILIRFASTISAVIMWLFTS